MKLLKKSLAICIATLLVVMGLLPGMAVKASAITNFTLEIGFADDYVSEQGHVEYQINDDPWVSVSVATGPQTIDQEVTSLKFRVVPNEFYEVNFDNGPTLEDATGFFFGAGGTDTERAALISETGYACTLVRTDESGDHGATKVSLKGVAFRETEAKRTADVSFDITGPGLEFWEEDIPSRITFRLPGTEDIAMGKGNLEWKDGKRPPDATGVKTVSPVQVTYDYDNSRNVTFDYVISNANTKITSLIINGKDCTSSCPQTDAEIFANIQDGGRSTKPISITVPYATAYDIKVVAAEHDLMGGFGWNYLPEENQSGDTREDCIAHGRLEFVKGEFNGTVYDSISAWNNASAYGAHVFNWTDGDKNYSDERDAWGSAAFPKEAKITLRLIPDEGYQLISLYGDQNLVREAEVGTYTITMNGGMNSHLMATFKEVEDFVNIAASAVNDGEVSNLQNAHGVGTMKLNVMDTETNAESREKFEGVAEGENAKIEEYIDINLANTVYKAKDDPNDTWDTPVAELDNPATIKLELSGNYEGKDLVIIHEHDGQYEVIPVEFDGKNTISFETKSFSNYAIATKEPEEDPEKPQDPENPDEPGDSSDPPSGDEHYTLNAGDNSLEFDDRKDVDYSVVILDTNTITDEQLAAMGASRADMEAALNQIKSVVPKEFLDMYVVMIMNNETGEETWGRQNLVLKLKKTGAMEGYENFRLIDVSEIGEPSYTGEEIKGTEEDGYIVFKLKEVGQFALIADKAEESSESSETPSSTPSSTPEKKSNNPATGDENNLPLWIILLAITISTAAFVGKKVE